MFTNNSIRFSQFYFVIILAGISIVTITGCEQSTSPERTGNIIGNVQQVDQWLRPYDDQSGITVSLQGTSYSDSTNAEGRYELENVTTGIYNIAFSKGGFGTNKIPFFDFVGGGNVYVSDPTNPYGNPTPTVGKIPTYGIEIDSTLTPQSGLAPIYISFSETVPDSGTAMVAVFQGGTPNVSADPSNYDFFQVFFVPSGFSGLHGDIIVDADSGSTRYLKAYPGAGISVFSDPEARSSNWAWASLGSPSEVVSITVPSTRSLATANKGSNALTGEFIVLGTEGEVIKQVTISEDDTQKTIAKKYQEIRHRISKLYNN